MEETAELAIRIAATGFEFHCEDEVFVVGRGSVAGPAVGEEAHAVPVDGLDASSRKDRAEFVDAVAAGDRSEPVDLPIGLERGEGRGPVAFQRGSRLIATLARLAAESI